MSLEADLKKPAEDNNTKILNNIENYTTKLVQDIINEEKKTKIRVTKSLI